jgi:hypothetical protein
MLTTTVKETNNTVNCLETKTKLFTQEIFFTLIHTARSQFLNFNFENNSYIPRDSEKSTYPQG